MSIQVPVGYVDIRVFAHATEDTEKVLTATRNILPPESASTLTFKQTALTGHHGNPITLLETRIKNKKAAQQFLEKLSSALSIMDKETLSSKIEQHLESGNLYLRLDKQSAYACVFKLSSTDPVHVRIHFKRPNPKEIIETCRTIGLLP